MNFSLFGLLSLSIVGLAGMVYMMFGHALTSAALFFGIGVLYDRYKTRLIFYYGALVIPMPVFSILYLIFVLSNFGFPGTIILLENLLFQWAAIILVQL
jgi:NADH-quinone oxidoreductase subunit M